MNIKKCIGLSNPRCENEALLAELLETCKEIEFFLRGRPGEASVLRAKVRAVIDKATLSSEGQLTMRINVYSQELTDEVQLETKESNTGRVYSAVRFMLHSSERLHHDADDDDRSAVTFWLPRSAERREQFALALEQAATMVRNAPRED